MKFIGHKKTKLVQFITVAALFTALIALIPFRLIAVEPGSGSDSTQRTSQSSASSVPGSDTARLLADLPANDNTRNRQLQSVQISKYAKYVLAELRGKDSAELRQIVPTVVHDEHLNRYLEDLARAEQQYAGVANDYNKDHPELKRSARVIEVMNEQVDNRVAGILAGLQVRADTEPGEIEVSSTSRQASSLQPGELARVLQEVQKKDRAELRQILTTLTHDTLLTEHLKALSEAEQKYAEVQNDYADEHPEVIKMRNVIKLINGQIENRIDGILAGLEVKANVEAQTETGPGNTRSREPNASSADLNGERELLEKQIADIRNEIANTEKLAPDRLSPDGIYELQRELFNAELELAKLTGDRAGAKEIIDRFIETSEQMLRRQEEQVQAGRAQSSTASKLRRDILNLKREQLALAHTAGPTTPERQNETRSTTPDPVSVHARVGGSVEKVLVSVGERVKKGQPLLEMDNSTAQSRLNTAEARAKISQADLQIAKVEFEEAQREYERRKQLAEDRLVPGDSLPNLEKFRANIVKAEAQAQLALLELEQTKQDMGRNILRAPRDGVVTFIIHEGYWVPEGSGKILAEIRTREGDRAAHTQTTERLGQELADLRAKERELSLKYTDKHFMVLNVRRQIADLENRLRQEEAPASIEGNLKRMKDQLASLRAEEARLLTRYRSKYPGVVEIRSQIEALEAQIRDSEGGANEFRELPKSLEPAVVTDLAGQPVPEVFVNGAVSKPGAISFEGERHLDILGAIARAGGFTQRANRNKIKFTRPGEDERVFSFEDLKNPRNRIPLLSGDIIEIPDKLF